MPLPTTERKRLATKIAKALVHDVMLRDAVVSRPHWFSGALPFLFAAVPGVLALVATDLALEVRVCLAVAVTTALGLGIENFRLKKKLKAAVALLELRERREAV